MGVAAGAARARLQPRSAWWTPKLSRFFAAAVNMLNVSMPPLSCPTVRSTTSLGCTHELIATCSDFNCVPRMQHVSKTVLNLSSLHSRLGAAVTSLAAILPSTPPLVKSGSNDALDIAKFVTRNSGYFSQQDFDRQPVNNPRSVQASLHPMRYSQASWVD